MKDFLQLESDLKLLNLFQKMKKITLRDILNEENSSCLESSLQCVAGFSVQIIERVFQLKDSEKVKKSTKQLALNELLQALKSLGLSFLTVAVPKVHFI